MEDYEITKVGDEYLVHSLKGTARKVHKYISRTYKKGRWYYEYPITGKGYLKETKEAAKEADKWAGKLSNTANNYDQNATLERRVIKSQEAVTEGTRMSESLAKMYDSLNDYESKSLKGKIESLLGQRTTDIRKNNIKKRLNNVNRNNEHNKKVLNNNRKILKNAQKTAQG